MESTNHTSLITTTANASSPVQNDSIVIPVEEKDSKVPKAPCVVCFVPVVGAGVVEDKNRIFEPLTQQEKDDDKLFQWFLINFRAMVKKKKGKKMQVERFEQLFKSSTVGWDGGGGSSPPLPFCDKCKYEVMGLMERSNSLEMFGKRKGEEDELKGEFSEIRTRMGKCEEDFLASGFYEKDKRYRRVRRYIINVATFARGFESKRQVEEDVDEEAAVEVPQGEKEATVMEVPCIICCETLKIFPEEVTFAKKEEDKKLFRWFLNNLQNPPGQKLFTKSKCKLDGEVTETWDGKGGMSEHLHFCGGCREGGMMEYFGGFRTKEMYQRRAKWIRMTRERMKECEDEFVKSGIYERDGRYFNVRRRVIKVVEMPRLLLKEVPREKKKRKAERPAVPVEKKKEEPKITLKFVDEGTGIPEVDNIMAQRFRKILPRPSIRQQVVKVVVKQEENIEEEEMEEKMEEDEEDEEDWPWEDEEEPPIIQVKEEEEDGERDPLGTDTGALEVEVGNDNLNKNQQHHRNCLLCYKAISKEESALAPVLTNDLNEQNFNSVFILRKMLNVPKERLVTYLEDFGCPGKWVEYCKNCLGLVDAALRIQKEISELEDKLRKCQEKMILKINSTSRKKKNRSHENSTNLVEEVTRITEETRQFVNRNVTRMADVVPEVASGVADDIDNISLGSPPPSPPDDHHTDPNYVDNSGPEQVDLKRSPAKKPKLSVEDKLRIQNRSIHIIPAPSGKKNLKAMKGGEYTCSLCPTLKIPMSFIKFYRHLIFHAQRPFKCSTCNVYWASPSELEKNPFVNESASSSHVCTEASLVKIPNGKFNPGKIWECKCCPEKFDMEKERDLHEKDEHSMLKSRLEMKYNCLSCSSGGKRRTAYRSHKEWLLHRALEHPHLAAISCLFCNVTAATKTAQGIGILNLSEMKSHVSSKHPACRNFYVSPETCDFCGIAFKFGKDYLASHIKDDHKLTSGNCTYSCPCCYFRTSKLENLSQHLARCHSLNPVPRSTRSTSKPKYVQKMICDVCGKVLRGALVLMEHKLGQHGLEPKEMSEYTGQQVFACERGDECGGFRTLVKPKMQEHMVKKHEVETKWRCKHCGKGFANSSHLARHLDIHKNKGLKPHQCELCGNSFAVRNYLYIHMRLSHQNRPFASTNKKRTTKRGARRVTKASTSVGPQSSSVDSMGIPVQPPPTQISSATVRNGESVNCNYNDGQNVDMDFS